MLRPQLWGAAFPTQLICACCLSAASRPIWAVWQWVSEGVCHLGGRRRWPAGRFALCRLGEGRSRVVSAGPQ